VNTKHMKYLSFVITFGFILTLAGYLYLDQSPARNIAHNKLKIEDLTSQQKQKWSVVEQFSIKQTNKSLLIDIPHAQDLCAENESLLFTFSAYEVSIAAENPNIDFSIACAFVLAGQQTQFEVLFSDLISMPKLKEKKLAVGELTSKLLFSDQPLPARWNLSQILIQGRNGFEINQFEIQKVFGHNFEFELELH
jgi:hypothetical protein